VPIFQIVLTKVDQKPSESLKARFIRLYHFISAKQDQGMGADFFISIIDQIHPKAFVPLYLKVILEGTNKLTRPLDRKVAVISLTKTLTDSQAFAERYEKGWGFTCDRLLELLINPPLPPPTDDLIAEHDVDDMAFGVGFTQLVTIKRLARDDWPEIVDVKQWVGQYLMAADGRQNGKIALFVQSRLSQTSREALVSYMQR
jgi:exportin-2 (importin alpha re-exporter)